MRRSSMLLCLSVLRQAQDDSGEIMPPELWEEMLDALDAVSPLVDDVRPGLAFLDMHGISGDAPMWIAQTHRTLLRFGCALRTAVGANKIAAWAALHVADGSRC